jgi:hypothetical protein
VLDREAPALFSETAANAGRMNPHVKAGRVRRQIVMNFMFKVDFWVWVEEVLV